MKGLRWSEDPSTPVSHIVTNISESKLEEIPSPSLLPNLLHNFVTRWQPVKRNRRVTDRPRKSPTRLGSSNTVRRQSQLLPTCTHGRASTHSHEATSPDRSSPSEPVETGHAKTGEGGKPVLLSSLSSTWFWLRRMCDDL